MLHTALPGEVPVRVMHISNANTVSVSPQHNHSHTHLLAICNLETTSAAAFDLEDIVGQQEKQSHPKAC